MKLFSRYALQITSEGDYLTISDCDEVDISHDMSMRIRFKLYSLPSSSQELIIKDNEYRLELSTTGGLTFSVYDGTDWTPNVDCGTIASSTWYDIIMIISQSNEVISKTLYINSLSAIYSETTQEGSVSSTANDLLIGKVEGDYDIFQVWNDELTTSEITDIFDRKYHPYGLDLFLSFEDGSGAVVEDVIDNNHGSMNSSNYSWTKGKELDEVYDGDNKIVAIKKY